MNVSCGAGAAGRDYSSKFIGGECPESGDPLDECPDETRTQPARVHTAGPCMSVSCRGGNCIGEFTETSTFATSPVEYRGCAFTPEHVMGYPRKLLVAVEDTPYYHCISRCVRRSWLWGRDDYAGKDFSHRKAWVLERLALLTDTFAIEVCAYAVMSNHYHLVLYIDHRRPARWSEREVCERWSRVFRVSPLVDAYLAGQLQGVAAELARATIETWRARLCSVSWFMKCMNEYLARRANAEDGCDGRFWEGRFKSQALLDESGLLTAMAYVDLNPVRAGIAAKPEDCEYTSVYERIRSLRSSIRPRVPLRAFRRERSDGERAIPFSLRDYLSLVDWAGRAVRSDGSFGRIDSSLPPILVRLKIEPRAWSSAMARRPAIVGRALGKLDRLRIHAQKLGQGWIRGSRMCAALFG